MDYNKLNILKDWRDDLARKCAKPAYYILTNKNLKDALELNPTNPEELEQISGWGPKKIKKYGKELLSMINEDIPLKKEGIREKSGEKETHILSVSEYINFINLTVQQFGELKITGEINDLNGMNRGLAFFDLKDSKDHESTMQCVVFRSAFQYLEHFLEEGLEVIVYGTPSIYPKTGNFKFVVSKIEPVGEGAYKKALEKLRKKLKEKGFFSAERKRLLPKIINKIGLITSSNGAAIHDFKRNLGEFGFQVYLKNVYVEGDWAEDSIIDAIEFFNKQPKNLDTLVLIRGGGSWESLKTFNSERVVESIVASKIPIITGIGHESDQTFAGLSSDFDCSTPSITATFLTQTREKLLLNCENLKNALISSQKNLISKNQIDIEKYLKTLSYKIEGFFNQFETLSKKLKYLVGEKIFLIDSLLQRSSSQKNALISLIKFNIQIKEEELKTIRQKTNLLNPKEIIKRGYAILYSKSGKVINSVKKLKTGLQIKIELKDGNKEIEIK